MGLLDGWMAYAVTCDPGDMLIVSMTQDKARDFSKTRVDRAFRYSPKLHEHMSVSAHTDNTHDKMLKHGMWIKIAWPTVSQLSSSDYRYVALTDYDRMPDDRTGTAALDLCYVAAGRFDGEGDAFSLGRKRTTTFLSRGMCAVESSPGRDLADPNWKPNTPHEAPPVTGVLGIYNRSDRRRWYWPCPDCHEYFEPTPGLDLFHLPQDEVLLEMVRTADIDQLASEYDRIVCPHCGVLIDKSHKHGMNLKGKWIAEGQTITPDGVIHGEAPRSTIAGYWMGGVAAAYQSWHSLVVRYLQGLREYALSGSELTLQTTANTDQGVPYMSRLLLESARNASDPESRKDKKLERFIVPEDARFVVASVDVQGGQGARFVVQVHAVGVNFEQWLIDRYSITDSRRPGVDGGYAPIDPASYPEDWDILTELVVDATYRLQEDGKEIRIKMIAVDTGGEGKKGDGVTNNAYEWFRRLRRQSKHGRVMLVKGASTRTAPLIRESMVGGRTKADKGDVPLYLLNPNLLKDMVSASVKRLKPGAGYMHFPDWLSKSFFDELSAEVRQLNGTWAKVRKRNEAFDLAAYIRAACARLGVDKISWAMPPSWAAPLATNSDVITRDERRRMQAETAAHGARMPARRTVNRSSYVSR